MARDDQLFDIFTILQFGFLFSASSFVFVSLLTLILKARKREECMILPPVRINIIAWIFTSGFNLAYVSGSIISRMLPTVSSDMVFWTGSLYFSGSTAVSMSVLFLMIDRCFILLMPSKFDPNSKGKVSTANGVIVTLQFFFFIAVFVRFERPRWYETACETFSCVASNHGITLNVTRLIFGIINSVMAFMFFCLLWRYNKRRMSNFQAEINERRKSSACNSQQPVNSIKAKGNVFAAIAVLSQIIFNFIPNLVAFIYLELLDEILSSNFGPAVSTLTQLDALCSTIVYLKIIGGRMVKIKQSESS